MTYALDAEANTLYVCHFVAGEGTIAGVGGTSLRISQETDYPWSGDVKITLDPQDPVELMLKLRIPDRTESDLYTATPDLGGEFAVEVNGAGQTLPVENGFVSLRHTWQSGDVVALALPVDVQRVHCDERVRANLGRVALIRGPIAYNIESVDHEHDVRDLILPPDAPLKAVWRPELLGGVMAVEGLASVESDGARKPAKLFAVPNYVRLNRGGRSLVWITEDPEKTVAIEGQSRPVVKPIVREELDRRTVDRVVIGNAESEKRHELEGTRTGAGVFRGMLWRHAGNGWFSYKLRVKPDAKNVLLCTYWGSDTGNRRFGILVDDREIAHQTLNREKPEKFFDIEYPIPEELTRGKERVTVRLQSDAGAMAGGVFDLRIVLPDGGE
jgi:hypothetical protein